MQNNRPSKQLTYWSMVSVGEWIMSIAMTAGMRKAQSEIDAVKTTRHNAKHMPVTAASMGESNFTSKFAGSDAHLANAKEHRGPRTDQVAPSSAGASAYNASTVMNTAGGTSGAGATSARSTGIMSSRGGSSMVSSAGASSFGGTQVPVKTSQVVPV